MKARIGFSTLLLLIGMLIGGLTLGHVLGQPTTVELVPGEAVMVACNPLPATPTTFGR